MDKQTPTQLFLSIFLRAAVAILGVVICVFGIYFLTKYVKNGSKDNDKPASAVDANVLTEVGTHDDLLMKPQTTTEKPTDTDATDDTDKTTEDEKKDDSKDKNILVLNSTSQIGLAGGWCATLGERGYKYTTASDFSNELQRTKIVAQKNGDGKELMELFRSPIYEVGVVTDGAPFETGDYDIVIIIGTNDATEDLSDDDNDDADDTDDTDDYNDDADDADDYADDADDYADDTDDYADDADDYADDTDDYADDADDYVDDADDYADDADDYADDADDADDYADDTDDYDDDIDDYDDDADDSGNGY